MKYKGIELKEITEPQVFVPPKKMLVWNEEFIIGERMVVAILSKKTAKFEENVICISSVDEKTLFTYRHCAEIPEAPKPRRATNRELSKWLAQGNGEYKEIITDHDCCMTYFYYSDRGRDAELPKGIKVRKWSNTEWHEPTVDYLGIDDIDYNFNKKYSEV